MSEYPKLPFMLIQWGYFIAIGIWANGETRVRYMYEEILMEDSL